jgi:hypothetical protein
MSQMATRVKMDCTTPIDFYSFGRVFFLYITQLFAILFRVQIKAKQIALIFSVFCWTSMTQSVGGGGPFGTILKWHHCVIGVWQNVATNKRVQQIHLKMSASSIQSHQANIMHFSLIRKCMSSSMCLYHFNDTIGCAIIMALKYEPLCHWSATKTLLTLLLQYYSTFLDTHTTLQQVYNNKNNDFSAKKCYSVCQLKYLPNT